MNGSNRRPQDRLGRPRSPATLPGSNAGVPSKHKGRRRANVPLSPAQVKQVMNYWAAQGVTGIRNRAIIRLIYWEGLQIDQTLRLEADDWDRDRNELTLPPRGNAPRTREGIKRKKVALSESSRDLLVAWWEARATLDAGPGDPLFCQVMKGRSKFTTSSASFRQSLRICAKSIGLTKPLSTEVLRASGRDHRLHGAAGLIEGSVLGYLHEDIFQLSHPAAFASWSRAAELLHMGAESNATAIGHECREALSRFSTDLALRFVKDANRSFRGSIDRLRAVIEATQPHSEKVVAHLGAQLAYWGTTLDLAHRQEHGAEKKDPLSQEDARRLVFHTMVVMYEWDRFAALV